MLLKLRVIENRLSSPGLEEGPDGKRGNRGFTIIELMIVLLILGLTLTYGVPAFQQTLQNNRLQTELFALRSTLTNARSEAMARRRAVFVCASNTPTACANDSSAWTNGFLAFADDDTDGVLDPNEVFLVRQVNVPDDVTLRFLDAGGSAEDITRFSQRGDSLEFAGTFVLCDQRGANEARALVLLPSGSVNVAIDDDDDGVVEDADGDNVSCP